MVHNSQTFPVLYLKPAPLKQHTKIPSQESACLTGVHWSQPLSSKHTSNRTEAPVARIPRGSCCRSTSLVPASLSCSNLCPNETTPCFVCVGAVDRPSHWYDLCMHKFNTVCQSKASRDSEDIAGVGYFENKTNKPSTSNLSYICQTKVNLTNRDGCVQRAVPLLATRGSRALVSLVSPHWSGSAAHTSWLQTEETTTFSHNSGNLFLNSCWISCKFIQTAQIEQKVYL